MKKATLFLGFVLLSSTAFAETPKNESEFGLCMEKADGRSADVFICLDDEYLREQERLDSVYKSLDESLSQDRQITLEQAQNAWLAFQKTYERFICEQDWSLLGTSQRENYFLRRLNDMTAHIYYLEQVIAPGPDLIYERNLSLDCQKCLRQTGDAIPAVSECLEEEINEISERMEQHYRQLMEALPKERREYLSFYHDAWNIFHNSFAEFYYNPKEVEHSQIRVLDWRRRSLLSQSNRLWVEWVKTSRYQQAGQAF